MNRAEFTAQRKIAETPSGRIAYVEQGDGPVAIFLHGILFNKYFWRRQLALKGQVSPPLGHRGATTSWSLIVWEETCERQVMNKKGCRVGSRSGGRWWRRFEQASRCERLHGCIRLVSSPCSGGCDVPEIFRWRMSIGVIGLRSRRGPVGPNWR